MKLYIVRHGAAVNSEIDPARPLSDRGKAAVKRIADRCAALGIRVPRVWHSGKLRARQTAEILAREIATTGSVEERASLSPNDPIGPVLDELQDGGTDLCIVGHLPFLAKLAAALTTGSESGIAWDFAPGAMLCLERENDGPWTVLWFLRPEHLKR